MSSYAPLLAALVALLAGLTDRQGVGALQAARRPVDRSPPRARVAALHPRPELPRRQPDRSRDRGAEQGRQPRRRRARSPHDSRQPVPRKGPGRQGDHGAPEPAAAAEPEQARARLRAALPRPRLQARRLRRSRARGVQRGAAARSEERVRAASTCRSCTRNSISGPRRTTRGSGCRSWPTSTRGRRARRFSRSSRTRSASRRCAARTTPEAIRRFEAAIDLDARAVPAYLNLGDVRVAQGNEREAAAIWETADRGRARSRLPRVRSARGAGDPHRQPGALHAAVPAADRREPAGLARAARAVTPSGGERPAARRARSAVRGARAESARAQHPPGDLARARPAAPSRRRSSTATAS